MSTFLLLLIDENDEKDIANLEEWGSSNLTCMWYDLDSKVNTTWLYVIQACFQTRLYHLAQ